MASSILIWGSLANLPKFLFGEGEKGSAGGDLAVDDSSLSNFHASSTIDADFLQRPLSGPTCQVSVCTDGASSAESVARSRTEIAGREANFVERSIVNCVERVAVGTPTLLARIKRRPLSSEGSPNIFHNREITKQPSTFRSSEQTTNSPSHSRIDDPECHPGCSRSISPRALDNIARSLQRARSFNTYDTISGFESPLTHSSSSVQRLPTVGEASCATCESLSTGEDIIVVKKTRANPSHKHAIGKVLPVSKLTERFRANSREGSLKSFLSARSSFSGDILNPPNFLGRYRTPSTPELRYKNLSTSTCQPRLKSRSISLTSLKHQSPPSRRLLYLDVSNHNTYVPLKTPKGIIHINPNSRYSRQHAAKIPVLTPDLIFLIERLDHVPASQEQSVNQLNSLLRLHENRPLLNPNVDSPLTLLSMELPSTTTMVASGTAFSTPEDSGTSSVNEESSTSSTSGVLGEVEIDGPMGTPPNSPPSTEDAETGGPNPTHLSILLNNEANRVDDSSSVSENATGDVESGQMEPHHPVSSPATASKREAISQQSPAHSAQAGVLHTLEGAHHLYEQQAAEANNGAVLTPIAAAFEPHFDGHAFQNLPSAASPASSVLIGSSTTARGQLSPAKPFNRRTVQTSAVANYGSGSSAGGEVSNGGNEQSVESSDPSTTGSVLQSNVNNNHEESESAGGAISSETAVHDQVATPQDGHDEATNGSPSAEIFERRPPRADADRRTIASAIFTNIDEDADYQIAPEHVGLMRVFAFHNLRALVMPRYPDVRDTGSLTLVETPSTSVGTNEDLPEDTGLLSRLRTWLGKCKCLACCFGANTQPNSDDVPN